MKWVGGGERGHESLNTSWPIWKCWMSQCYLSSSFHESSSYAITFHCVQMWFYHKPSTILSHMRVPFHLLKPWSCTSLASSLNVLKWRRVPYPSCENCISLIARGIKVYHFLLVSSSPTFGGWIFLLSFCKTNFKSSLIWKSILVAKEFLIT